MLGGNRRKMRNHGGNGMMRNNQQMQRNNFQSQQNFNAPQLNDQLNNPSGYMDFSNNFNESSSQQAQHRQQNNNNINNSNNMMGNKRRNQQNQSPQKRMKKNFQNGGGGGNNKNWNQQRRNNNNNNNSGNGPMMNNNSNNNFPPQFNNPPHQMINQRMPMRNNNMPPFGQMQRAGRPMNMNMGPPNMGGGNQGMRRPFQGNFQKGGGGKFNKKNNQNRKNNNLNKVNKPKNRQQSMNKKNIAGAINRGKKKQRDPYSLEAPYVTDEIKAEHAKKEEIMESMKGKGKNDELFNKFKEQREIFIKKYDEAKAAYLAEKKVNYEVISFKQNIFKKFFLGST